LAYKGYTPEYERLADAVRQVVAAGATETEARRDISTAIADGAIHIRLTVEKPEDYYGDHRIDKVLPGDVLLPRPLLPEDLDWERSRPRQKWSVGPIRADGTARHILQIALIELRSADVLKVLCERVSKQNVEALVTLYRDGLAGGHPSIEAFEAFAQSRGLSGHREQLRAEYRKKFPNRRVGRPKR
jgi:hypothetical protein